MSCVYSTPEVQLVTEIDNWVGANCNSIIQNLQGLRQGAENYNSHVDTVKTNLSNIELQKALQDAGIDTSTYKFNKMGQKFPADSESNLEIVFTATVGIKDASGNLRSNAQTLAQELGKLIDGGTLNTEAETAARNARSALQGVVAGLGLATSTSKNLSRLNDEYKGVKSGAVSSLETDAKLLALKDATVGLTPAEKKKLDNINKQLQALNAPVANLGSVLSADQEQIKRTFKEQCFLLAFMDPLAKHKSETIEFDHARALPYVNGDIASTQGHPAAGKNCSLLIDRHPWGFMNLLTQSPNFKQLFEIDNASLGQLSPYIELKKIIETDDGSIQEVTMNFDASAATEAATILSNKDKRGFGVGIKNFTFSYEGSNPFAVKKSIKAKLVLFASSFDDLLKIRGSAGAYYRYVDLALKTGSNLKDKIPPPKSPEDYEKMSENIGKLNFRLKAIVGWANPVPGGGAPSGAINDSYVTLTLTPTIHEFDIDDMGRVTFTINYLSYIEDFFDQPNYNIFTDVETNKSMFKRREKYKQLQKSCKPDEMASIKKADAEIINFEKAVNLRNIALELLRWQALYFIEMKYTDMINFIKQGPFYNYDPSVYPPQYLTDDDATQTQKDIVQALEEQYTPGNTPGGVANLDLAEYIVFFYLSDLVDIILSGIGNLLVELEGAIAAEPAAYGPKDLHDVSKLRKSFEKFRVILGPMEVVDPKHPGQMRTCSLGDIPVSLKYFMDWMTDNTLKKERTEWTLPTFLNSLLNNFIRNFLNNDSCYDVNIKQKTRLFQNNVTAYNNKTKDGVSKNDQITDMIIEQRKLAKKFPGEGWETASRLWADPHYLSKIGWHTGPLLNVMGTRGDVRPEIPGGDTHYLVYYAGRVQPTDLMNGNYSEDAKNGIFHYILGRDRGLVKTISLVKTDSPGLKEVRFEQEGYDGLAQLREVYDAKIDTYGMPNAVPGTYIYIDPNSFAPGAKNLKSPNSGETRGNLQVDPYELTRYGIGGYYMIYHAENKFGPGECSTTISAKWVAQLEKEAAENNKSKPKADEPKSSPSKCKTKG